MSEEEQNQLEKEMNFTGHLSELRNRIIVTVIFFIGFFILGFIYVKDIYYFFKSDVDFSLIVTGPGDIVWIYFMMAGLVAVAGTIPILCLQVWLFIKPGLTANERKASLAYIPAVFILFLVGLTFGYILFIKLILPFLLSLNDGMFDQLFTVDKYFKFLLRITVPFAILFEIPVVAMFLTSLGIITPDYLKKIRKYAYFVLVIIGTIVTPPDFILQIVVAIPLIILYEISIYFAQIVYNKRLKKHQEFMDE